MGWLTDNELTIRDVFSKFAHYLVFKRFLKYVKIGEEDECWEWEGSLDENGRGVFNWLEKKIHNAHVAAYVLFIGSRHGLYVCHSCDNGRCVNPNHLWLGTQKQNMEDMVNKNRQSRAKWPVKLNHDKAKTIRKLYRKGPYTRDDLAKKFDVGVNTIGLILSKKIWKDTVH